MDNLCTCVTNHPSMSEESESRHGKPMAGWKRVAMQLPLSLTPFWHKEAEIKGPNSVKIMGTLATGILLGMPKEVRDQLFQHVARMTWKDAGQIEQDAIWATFRAVLDAHENGEALAPDWQVSRIADPELTPPRGQKASDRPIVQRSGRAKGA